MRKSLFPALLWLSLFGLSGCEEIPKNRSRSNTGSIQGTITLGAPLGVSGLYDPVPAPLPAELPKILEVARNMEVKRQVRTTRDGEAPFVAGDVLVRVDRPNLPPEALLERVQLDGLEVAYGVPVMPRWHLVKVRRDGAPIPLEETPAIVEAIKRLEGVDTAEPNWIEQPLAVPGDNYYKLQWHYPQMQLPAAWDVTRGAESVVVAVVDTGIVSHPDLSSRVVAGIDMISDPAIAGDGDGRDDNPRDEGRDLPRNESSWHGTHVAGTIGASTDNDEGVAGVDWNCRILPVRVLGRGGGTAADIAAGMAWAVGVRVPGVRANATPAQVVNLSLGGDGPAAQIYQDAIDEGNARGAVFVIAAGNENENTRNKRPANQQNVITVGSVGFTGKRASYSNFGAEVDVMAPGGEMAQDANGDGQPDGVLSTFADSNGSPAYNYQQGTSMAAPHVAGVVALLKSVDPSIDFAQAEQILKETAVGAYRCNEGCGSGLVNALAAVLRAKKADPTGPPQLGVSNRELTLAGATSGVIGVSNLGGGQLTVKATALGENAGRISFPEGSSKTLGAAQADVITVEVDGSGLETGDYSADVSLDAGDAGLVSVRVNFKVGMNLGGKPVVVGVVYENARGEWEAPAAILVNSAESFGYRIDGLPPRAEYYVLAGVDEDEDEEYFEDGERFGMFRSIAQPQPVPVQAGKITGGVDFAVISVGTVPGDEGGSVGIGGACDNSAQCGGTAECDPVWPDGYCYSNCSSQSDCPNGSVCTNAPNGYCLRSCNDGGAGQADCRPGYVCGYLDVAQPVCVAACRYDEQCKTGNCNRSTGFCE